MNGNQRHWLRAVLGEFSCDFIFLSLVQLFYLNFNNARSVLEKDKSIDQLLVDILYIIMMKLQLRWTRILLFLFVPSSSVSLRTDVILRRLLCLFFFF